MGTVSFDFDAQAGYNSGVNIADLYAPVLGTNGPSGWRLQPSDTSRAVTFAFRAVAYGGANITVAVDWYSLTATTGTVTLVASISAQNPTGSGESAETPTNATTVSNTGTVGAVLNQSVRTIITIPNASADGLTADWLAYLRLYRNDATAGDIVVHRVTVSYSDGINAPLQGPASSTVGNIATMNNTTGTLLADSGVAATAVALGAASSVAGNVASYTNTGGKQLSDSGLSAAALVTSIETVGGSISGELVQFNDTGGRIVVGSGTTLASIVKNTGPSVTDGNVVKFFGTSGLDLRDAGVPAANLVSVSGAAASDIVEFNGTIWVPKRTAHVELASTFAITAAANTLADITGLSIALPRAGTYRLRATVRTVTTGTAGNFWFAFNYTGTVANICATGANYIAGTAAGFIYLGQSANNALTSTTGAGTQALSTYYAFMEGNITVSTTGTLTLRGARAATTLTATLQIGSSLDADEV